MRKLLQAIFFREAPERGAFFGLTLLFVLPWLSVAVFALLFLRTEWLSLVDFDPTDWWCVGLLVGSVVFLQALLTSLAQSIVPRRRWLRHTLRGCFLVAATGLVAVLIYLFYLIYIESLAVPYEGPGNGVETALTGAGYVIILLGFYGLWLLLHGLGRAVRRHPRQSLKFVTALLCTIGFMVAYCICGEIWSAVLGICALPPLLWFLYCLPHSRPAQCLGVCLLWYAAVDFAYYLLVNGQFFRYGVTEFSFYVSTPLAAVTFPWRKGVGVEPLAYLSAVFFLAAYLLSGWLLAKGERTTFRKLVGRGVLGVWLSVAITYAISVGLALHDQRGYRQVHADLEAHFGRPLKASELNGFYPPESPHSAEFWEDFARRAAGLDDLERRFADLFPYYKSDNWEQVGLSQQQADSFRTLLNDYKSFGVRELLDTVPPSVQEIHRDDWFYFEVEHSSDAQRELLRSIAIFEHWLLRFALEDRDFPEALLAFRRLKNIADWQCGQRAYSASSIFATEKSDWLAPMNELLCSGLATPEWLQEQEELLLSAEARLLDLSKTQRFFQALRAVNDIETSANGQGQGRQGALLRFRRLRWLSPPVWTAVVSLATDILRSHLHEKPSRGIGNFFLRFSKSFDDYNLSRQMLHYRIARGFIAAERFRQQTGSFAESLDNLPADPFCPEEPLHYAQTTVETLIDVWHEETYEGHECDCESCTPNCTCDQSSTYADWNTEARTIDVIKIWSVGPDGHDDGDAENTDDIGYYLWPAKYTGGLREGTE